MTYTEACERHGQWWTFISPVWSFSLDRPDSSLPLPHPTPSSPPCPLQRLISIATIMSACRHMKLTPSPDFPTIDPAPSSSPQSIPDLHTALLNTKLPLFERYRAMFALRDFGAGSKEAVLALADGFKDGSALFRYVPFFLFSYFPVIVPILLPAVLVGFPFSLSTGAQEMWCLAVWGPIVSAYQGSQPPGTIESYIYPLPHRRHLSTFPPLPLLPSTYRQPASTCYLR